MAGELARMRALEAALRSASLKPQIDEAGKVRLMPASRLTPEVATLCRQETPLLLLLATLRQARLIAREGDPPALSTAALDAAILAGDTEAARQAACTYLATLALHAWPKEGEIHV